MIGIRQLTNQNPALIVAEIGQAHDGSLGILHSYIDAISTTGVDAVKFQVHIAEAESSKEEQFRINFSKQDKSRFEYWKRMEFKQAEWDSIKLHCEEVGLEFIATPFSVAAIRLLEEIGCETFKIGSGDINNKLLLHHVRRIASEVIFSTGLATDEEVGRALAFFQESDVATAILKCTSVYPTPPSQLDFGGLSKFLDIFECPVGFSDHSGSIVAGIVAMALGARIFEAHVVFDKRMFGPDSTSSLTIDEFERLVEARNFMAEANFQSSSVIVNPDWHHLRELFGRSLTLRRNLEAGEAVAIEDLECTKPAGLGIASEDFERVLGMTLINTRLGGDFLRWEDLSSCQEFD